MGNQSRHPAIATVKRVQPQEAMVNRRYCDQAARRQQPARVVSLFDSLQELRHVFSRRRQMPANTTSPSRNSLSWSSTVPPVVGVPYNQQLRRRRLQNSKWTHLRYFALVGGTWGSVPAINHPLHLNVRPCLLL
jgi:hypothetical protein